MKKRREREYEQQKISKNYSLRDDCNHVTFNISIRFIILLTFFAAVTRYVIAFLF